MYNFVDTIEYSEGALLPSEALQINGEYIENQITGYRTLTVSGREALSPDVLSYTSGIRDGSVLQYKRYPERIITVKYQLIAASNEAFRAAYNKLGQILDVKEAQLIFNDETDKYFIGTPCVIEPVEAGRNSVIGEFEILCTDPFKYSIYEKEAVVAYDEEGEVVDNSIMIDYQGTYKAYPVLRAEMYNETEASEDGESAVELTGLGDCGYVAFFNENEKIIQLGNPDEVDGDSSAYPKSQTLINNTYKTTSSWGTAAKSQWTTSGTMQIGEAKAYEAEKSGTTNANILQVRCSTEAPFIIYSVDSYTYDRTETSVKVKITVTSWLENLKSYFRTPAEITGYIGFTYQRYQEYRFKIKKPSVVWNAGEKYQVSYTFTLGGLTAQTTAITGVKFFTRRDDSYGKTGELSTRTCSNIPVSTYTPAVTAQYYLTPSSYGTGTGWHGVTLSRNLPADAKGEIGAKNFTFSYSNVFYTYGAPASRGIFSAAACDSSGNVVAGITLQKSTQGTTATLKFHVNNEVVATQTVDVSINNKYFQLGKTTTITKSRSLITFNVCGLTKSFTATGISNIATTKIVFTFKANGVYAKMTKNGLQWVKFIKNNCDTWKDIPNKFSANDVVEADCKSGEIRLNGELMPALGALGNDWESFYLKPGLNQIGFSYSDWLDDEGSGTAPSFSVKYREVFL